MLFCRATRRGREALFRQMNNVLRRDITPSNPGHTTQNSRTRDASVQRTAELLINRSRDVPFNHDYHWHSGQ